MFKSSDNLIANMDAINDYQIDLVKNDIEVYKKDYEKMAKDIYHTTAIYKGAPVPFFSIPKLFTEQDILNFDKAVEDIFHIVNKTIDLYLENEAVRKMYNFDPRLDELIRIPSCYDTNVPMGRFDIFYNSDGSYQFCELNTDGTSAQSEEDGLSKMLMAGENVKALEALGYDLRAFELFDTWVDSVQEIYENYKSSKTQEGNVTINDLETEMPYVAIVDFINNEPTIEFEMFKTSFIERGFKCEIVDPREISCVDGKMIHEKDNQIIDIVYRRLVTRDMMERYDEIPGFIDALKANNTCVVGNIKTQVVHSKKFFAVLHNEEFQKYLTKKEVQYVNDHIPYTVAIKDIRNLDTIIDNKDDYLIKPVDYYASKGVYSGQDMSKEEWQELINSKMNSSDLLQCYCKVAVSNNVMFLNQEQLKDDTIQSLGQVIQSKNSATEGIEIKIRNITGMYVYNEKFAGVYSRGGLNSIISGLHDGYTLSSLVIKPKD